MKKLFLSLLLIFIFNISFSIDITEKILAIVNDELIFRSDLINMYRIEKLEKPYFFNNETITNEYKKNLLERLILYKVINILFKYNDINYINKNFEKYINKVSYNLLLNKNEFLEYLKFNKFNLNLYKKIVNNNVLINKIIESKIKVDEEMLNKNFKKNIYKYKDKNKKIINDALTQYNIDIFKIKKFKSNNLNYKKIYKMINSFKINENFSNKKYIEIFKKNNIEFDIKSKSNILYMDLPEIILKNLDSDKKTIGPIILGNNIFFIKVEKLNKKYDNNYIFKKVSLNILYINNKKNKDKNKNYLNILNLYNNLLNNKNNNIKKILNNKNFSNIKFISFKNKNIDFYENFIKKNINILNNSNNISIPLEYKNKYIILHLLNVDNMKYKKYLENFILNEYKFYSKNLIFINKIEYIIKNEMYIKII